VLAEVKTGTLAANFRTEVQAKRLLDLAHQMGDCDEGTAKAMELHFDRAIDYLVQARYEPPYGI
jgi:hypothetical protein